MPWRSAMCRYRLVTLSLFSLIAGAVITVAVAWCAVARANDEGWDEPIDPTPLFEWWRARSTNDDMQGSLAGEKVGAGLRVRGIHAVALGEDDTVTETETVLEISAGWPLRCLTGEYWDYWGISERSRLVSAAPSLPLLPSLPTWWFYPLGPKPLAFAVNTLFYATVVFISASSIILTRQRLRTRRGACPHCGYPLATLSRCPECGHGHGE